MAMSAGQLDDYQNVVVTKPWGYEYLMYQNDVVGLWYLFIRYGASTSLHCHPRKKTGLIVLSGKATVSFLNDSMSLEAPAKLMIRPGLFHSTAAVSVEGVSVIEIETPRDKGNLVRLEDHYGREDKPYEGMDSTSPLTDEHLRLEEPPKGAMNRYHLHGCTLFMEKVENVSYLPDRQPGDIIIVLEGGLFSSDGEPILSAGDAVNPATLNRLARSFHAPQGVSFLTIRKTD